ncbi:OadG family transporter subunit [Desulfosarcina ovata]|uniref:Oxaloacetate decarboxylase, gamma chain n=2 Tax=Desulfosarcina ovata TaxID=83564 RepID=A0A5K8AAX5_9BACT|nr:OadG family transporter subunit [Desulfosarcina ovata]BBO83442.1 hypothetical protein DSCO28_40080 [Desulfosarcina ovata subsp. sediminis]BBO89792.1 hypothetical protein DSCOOX_29720 [Desulfosarcina ovata subsp. ovata]
MYGLAAIQQANGWAMAGAGACIVLTGLAILSFLISLLPRLTGLFEPKAAPQPEPAAAVPEKEQAPTVVVPDQIPDDIEEACTIFMALTEGLGETFSLSDLHRKCRDANLANPHYSVNRFRDAGILIPAGEGLFYWKSQSE